MLSGSESLPCRAPRAIYPTMSHRYNLRVQEEIKCEAGLSPLVLSVAGPAARPCRRASTGAPAGDAQSRSHNRMAAGCWNAAGICETRRLTAVGPAWPKKANDNLPVFNKTSWIFLGHVAQNVGPPQVKFLGVPSRSCPPDFTESSLRARNHAVPPLLVRPNHLFDVEVLHSPDKRNGSSRPVKAAQLFTARVAVPYAAEQSKAGPVGAAPGILRTRAVPSRERRQNRGDVIWQFRLKR
jgi:hypothetical protein